MSGRIITTDDFKAFEKMLASAVNSARSLNEIKAWLKSKHGVESVLLTDYLLKSNPPQRDFIVNFRLDGDTVVRKIINIIDFGNGQFRFNELRDQ